MYRVNFRRLFFRADELSNPVDMDGYTAAYSRRPKYELAKPLAAPILLTQHANKHPVRAFANGKTFEVSTTLINFSARVQLISVLV